MVLLAGRPRRAARSTRCLRKGWLAAALAAASAAVAEPVDYGAVKAAYLVRFAGYVDWPATAFATPEGPLTLCVVGEDPFGNLIDEAAAGQEVLGHPLLVRRLKAPPRDGGCHVAYAGDDTRAQRLRSAGMLVVTDGAATPGMIHFVVRDGRVRFIVDDEAAAQSGLGISSKLLNVALSVKPRTVR